MRQDISLNENWKTIATENNNLSKEEILKSKPNKDWKQVSVPHNWDAYEGYRRLVHGNRHGDAWYRRTINFKQSKKGKRIFLFFEGVGSYATVYLNGNLVGEHAGGRTTFTIDITDIIKNDGSDNDLLVKASHPSNIKDLPWVCGGCSDERGFSEGSQPMGIFRPVHLIVTNDLRIEPFGVHAWADIKDGLIDLSVNTTIKNYSAAGKAIKVTHLLVDALGNVVTDFSIDGKISAQDSATLPVSRRMHIPLAFLKLWSTETPYLYNLVTTISVNGVVIDKLETDFGFRTINWKTPTHQFFLNDKPVFINGVAEYEHLLGQSHAFSDEQIKTRMKWLQLAGFNAFRDGHQPHNLLYGKLCNQKGILWWTQLSAHIWYDSPAFRTNFKQLLKEWVIERRNDPAVILWGLQNESKLPEDFARECTELIRSLDPTASTQRLVTTCNGGNGTDWDVPQNWTGTYGGNPATYAEDLKKQILIGEYGAWRTIDLHTEGGFVQNGPLSEDRMVQLMEQKIRLAESVKDSSAGQFFWLLTSHDNPGRVQGGEGLRELDRIGPVNYKGLLTPWEEPTDAFYMYRSNYASKDKEPMVYIVSHTWPNRWMKPGIKDSIYVYSNCDEVELFNDIDNASLGRRKRNGIGTHFQWDKVNIQHNILYAVGYVNGKIAARDTIVLFHLPEAPNFAQLYSGAQNITKNRPGYTTLFRLNCGGPDSWDENRNLWGADQEASTSWTSDFPGLPADFASQRRTFAPISNTKNWELFHDFRYGMNKLKFEFPYPGYFSKLPDGEYVVDLYFIEPWLGIGGSFNAKGMRVFDVAINGKTVIDDLDIWSEAGGPNTVLQKTVRFHLKGGQIAITFPEIKSGQAIISAIAISSKNKRVDPPVEWEPSNNFDTERHWLDIGDLQYQQERIRFNSIPAALYGAVWIWYSEKRKSRQVSYNAKEATNIYIAYPKELAKPAVLTGFEDTGSEIVTDLDGGTFYKVCKKLLQKDETIGLSVPCECIVAMQPATNMQPAYDLKPVIQYKASIVKLSEGAVKENVNGRESASVKTNTEVTIEYPIQIGAADIYSITMKYFYAKEQPVKGKLQLIGAGNTMMREEEVSFTFTREGKWNQFTINTGSQINAGNYIVRLIVENAKDLAISGIDVQ